MTRDQLLALSHIHREINTCVDDNLEMICEKLNKMYSLSFFELWDFCFNEEQEDISKRIYLKEEINKRSLEKYCGIILDDMECSDFGDMLKEIRRCIKQNIPVMLHMYRKLFPWDENYNKENVPDFFVHKAMAIDINEKEILFTDGYCNKFNEWLSIDICEKSTTKKITKIYIKEDNKIDIKEYFNQFKEVQKQKVGMFDNLYRFSKELNEASILADIKNCTPELYKYSELYNSLNKITRTRKKIKKMLEDLGQFYNNYQIKELAKGFDKDIVYWEYINLSISKYIFTSNVKNLKKASTYIESIIDIEKKLYDLLERIEL